MKSCFTSGKLFGKMLLLRKNQLISVACIFFQHFIMINFKHGTRFHGIETTLTYRRATLCVYHMYDTECTK